MAFSNCHNLTSVNIPNNVSKISNMAFCGCNNLESVIFSNDKIEIGNYVFKDCPKLQNSEGLVIVNGVLCDCFTENVEIVLPKDVTKIGWAAFKDCSTLKSIIIPDSVSEIGWAAFNGCCSLNSIKIPSCVTDIQSETFSNCTELLEIYIPNSVTSFSKWEIFDGCPNLTICAPIGSEAEKYAKAMNINYKQI